MNLKKIDLTNGQLPQDPDYIYFIDEDDPMGDIISMKRSQGARHEDIIINKEPKKYTISVKKKGKIKNEPCGTGLIEYQSEEFKGTFKEI